MSETTIHKPLTANELQTIRERWSALCTGELCLEKRSSTKRGTHYVVCAEGYPDDSIGLDHDDGMIVIHAPNDIARLLVTIYDLQATIERRDGVIKILERDVAEARAERDLQRARAERFEADNAALVEFLNRAQKELLCVCEIECSHAYCAWCREHWGAISSQSHPGAALLEELAALRKVLDASRWAYNYDVPSDVDTVTIRADEWHELRQAHHEYDARAIRNREVRA